MVISSGYGRAAPELSIGAKLLRFNWMLAALLTAVASVGFLMLFSISHGSLDPYARPQIVRFAFGFGLMLLVALIDIRIWRAAAIPFYVLCLAMLVGVELTGEIGKGAQRWLKLGPLSIQPSEFMKIALVAVLAYYYDKIPADRLSRPFWVIPPLLIAGLPTLLVLKQPDLGTALLLMAGAVVVMFLAGVNWRYFAAMGALGGSAIAAVFLSRGTDWQILKDYQYRRIETFLDPSRDPLGAGYHINQSLTAIGSGGVDGKGFMNGTQTRLSFLPEPHTDFIFTTLAEEFGLVGGMSLLALFAAIIVIATISAMRIRSTFGRLLAAGVAATFFFFFAINMAMVMGLAPVVGVPLPLVSYGGTSMLALLFAFGLAMSAEIHDGREE